MSVLPVPGGPVQEQPAAQVAALRAQRVDVAVEAQRAALDALQHAVGQHDPVARDLPAAVERHRDPRRAERGSLLAQRDDLAAVDVVLGHEPPQLGDEAFRRRRLARHDLDERGLVGVALVRDEHREAVVAVAHEQQAERDARNRAPLVELDHRPSDAPTPTPRVAWPPAASFASENSVCDGAEMPQLRRPGGGREIGVERGLDVRPVVLRRLEPRDRKRRRALAEVSSEPGGEAVLARRRPRRPLEAALEALRELARLEAGVVGHRAGRLDAQHHAHQSGSLLLAFLAPRLSRHPERARTPAVGHADGERRGPVVDRPPRVYVSPCTGAGRPRCRGRRRARTSGRWGACAPRRPRSCCRPRR